MRVHNTLQCHEDAELGVLLSTHVHASIVLCKLHLLYLLGCDWWLVLIYYERTVLLTGCYLVAGADLV